jgi:hypothetical protein
VCSLLREKESRRFWIQTGLHIRLYPHRLTPHPQILAGAHKFPPHLSGVPPDPVPPLRLQMRCCKHLHLPKLGGAGGSPRVLPRGGKTAFAVRDRGRVRCAPRLGLRCSAGRTGSAGYAADRTPAGAGARPPLGRRSLRSADKCGGLKHHASNRGARPIRVGSLRSPVLAARRVLTIARRYPHQASGTLLVY